MVKDKKRQRVTPFFWRQLFWKMGLILLLLLLLSQVAVIWFMGAQETADAFSSGRRLIVALDSGAIEGKIISSVPPVEEAVEKVPEKTPDIKEPDVKEAAPEKEPEKESSVPPKVDDETTKNAATEQPKEAAPVEEIVTVITPQLEDEILPAIVPSTTPPAEISKDLSDKTEFGTLPKISSDGNKPWKYYAKTITAKDKKPIIAVIVTGLGQNKNISELALRLPEEINLSFSPYSKDLTSWITSARISGHEILIDLPMEASNYPVSDPGPLGLLVSKEQKENDIKIKKLMASGVGYVGFLTPYDDIFLDNNELFKSLLQVLSGRGLMLVVGRQPAKNETKEMIEKGNTASVIIDALIDEELTPVAIQARLSLLEQTAKQRGYAVGVAKAYPITIKQLNEWASQAEKNGFNLVPVSAIVSKRF
jgi:polysaccharide deacetylase 2 family uncharacterized protein YibQ